MTPSGMVVLPAPEKPGERIDAVAEILAGLDEAALRAMRARVLHDLANLDMVVAESCASLEYLVDPLRRALQVSNSAASASTRARTRGIRGGR